MIWRPATALLAAALAGCAPGVAAQPRTTGDSYAVGERRDSGIGKYRKLLFRESGWSVWEVAAPHLTYCVATKPGIGQPTALPWEGFVSLLAAGGSGFYVTAGLARGERYYSGFYGAHGVRKSEVVEIDGRITSSAPRADLRQYDGKRMRYEVTTGPYRHIYDGTRTQAGTIDLAGVSGALDRLDQCLSTLPRRSGGG